MTASAQIINTEIFAFIAILVLSYWTVKVLFKNRKDNRSCEKEGYFFKEIVNFMGKILQTCKQLECEIFRVFFKHLSDDLSVSFEFAWLYL